MRIDLNADLGEGCQGEDALLGLISSANVACGAHAGDPLTMWRTVAMALERGVAVGAHPSYFDRENFGRTEQQLPAPRLRAELLAQLGALSAIVTAQGGRLAHVKPHGALYNQATIDAGLSRTIVAAVREFDPALIVFGLAGGELVAAARQAGQPVMEEVFADRGYTPQGTLVRRGTPGALIEQVDEALERTLVMVREQRVRAIDGTWVPIRAETICLHGDGAHALEFARAIRAGLGSAGISITAP